MSNGMKMVLLLLSAITAASVAFPEQAVVLLGTALLGLVGLFYLLTQASAHVYALQQKQLELNEQLIKRMELLSQATLLLRQEIGLAKQQTGSSSTK